MPIATHAAGERLSAHTEEISTRRLLAYAAGIGATEAPFFDDARSGGIVAVPAFCVSLEWPVVSCDRSRELLQAPAEELRRGVHASQDSFFHRPIRPGDRLVTEATVTAVEPTRAGALVTIRLRTVVADTGEAVVTSWSRSLYRGVEIRGEARVVEPAPAVDAPPAPAAPQRVTLAVAAEMPHVYTECARIWNPIHTERTVALAAGLPDIILHGTATWALAGREIVRRYCDGEPGRLRRLHGRFRAMVRTDSEIHLDCERCEGGVHFAVLNDAGEPAISHGLALVDDGRRETEET